MVNIVINKAFEYDADGKATQVDIPAAMADEMAVAKEEFIENIAELNDDLLEKYLEGEDLSEEEVKATFRKGISEAQFYPAICISAAKMIGIDTVLDFINTYLPSPLDRETGLPKTARDRMWWYLLIRMPNSADLFSIPLWIPMPAVCRCSG